MTSIEDGTATIEGHEDAVPVPLPHLLLLVSEELSDTEARLSALQTTLSNLVTSGVGRPDSLRDVQSLDLITQTIGDLARLTAYLGKAGDRDMMQGDLLQVFRLRDVADRILCSQYPNDRPGGLQRDERSPNLPSEPAGDVAWL